MNTFTRAAAAPAILATALTAGCALTPPSAETTLRNDPNTAGTTSVAYGSHACREAQVRVVRTNSLMAPAYDPRAAQAAFYAAAGPYTAYQSYFNYAGPSGVLAQTTLTSNTGEKFTMIPTTVPKAPNAGFGAIFGGVAGNMIGGGSVRVAATVLGAFTGYTLGAGADEQVKQRQFELLERCGRDVEAGAYNRPGGPIQSDLQGLPDPYASWNGRIDHLRRFNPR